MSSKKKRSYRSRISSKKEQTKIAEHAHDSIDPPSWMNKKAMPFFENIITRRANVDWNPHDIDVAALLAMNILKASIAHKRITREFETDDVQLKISMQLLKEAESKIIALRRTLNIHQASYGSSAERASQRSNQAAKLEHEIKLVAEHGKYLD